MNFLMEIIRRRPSLGRSLGVGWLVSFALGYVVRDLLDDDSDIRKRFSRKRKRTEPKEEQ